MRGYNLHLDTGRREAKRTRLMSIAEEIKPGVYGLVSLLSFLVFAAAYTRDNYAIAAPVAVITIGFALVAMAMLYVRWRVEIADLRAERDHWKDVAGHAGERCVNLERVLADAQARIAELDGAIPDIKGMQDGSLVRDLRAEKARLEAALAEARELIALLERQLDQWSALQPSIDALSMLLGVCEGVNPLPAAAHEIARLRRALGAYETPWPDDWRPGCGHGRFFRVGASDQVYCTDCLDFRPGPALDAAGLVLGSDPVASHGKCRRRYYGIPGHCVDIDGAFWHEPGSCPHCGYEDLPASDPMAPREAVEREEVEGG